MPGWLRARTRYFALAVGTIVLGLAVHGRGGALSPVVRDVLGDALWAAMAAWWIAAVAPAIRLAWRAAVALAFCFGVEFSQLVHLPALDALRRTTAGHLALGSGFDRRDFVAYAAGARGGAPRTGNRTTPVGQARRSSSASSHLTGITAPDRARGRSTDGKVL
jgi:Protein of unknown function (DUF2809)